MGFLRTVTLKMICFIVVTKAASIKNNNNHEGEDYPRYKFAYGVHDPHTKDIKRHHEERDGKYVKGFYTFMEADGSIRIVHYKVGPHSGFEAIVERILHPSYGDHTDEQENAINEDGRNYEVYEETVDDAAKYQSNEICENKEYINKG